MTSTSTCTITVEDANDNAPVFIGQMEFHVTEGEYVTPTSFGTIETNDDDVGANGIVTYRILRQETQSGQLGITIDPNTGELRVRGTLDREKYLPDGLFRITVLATDSAPLISNQLSKMGIVNVIVDDINDVTPEFTNADTFLVPPNSIANVGYVVGRVHAMDTDAGVNGEVVYSLDTESSIFTINQQTGVIRISNPIQGPGVLYQVEIVAKDKGTPARSNTMVLNVIVGRTDSNNGPVFERSSYTASIVENMAAGTNLVTVTATGNQVAYYITSTTSNSESTIRPFAIHHTTGIISNLMTLDRENGVTSYTVQVVAVDMTSNVNNPRITSTNVRKQFGFLVKYAFK
uniref:protocadherin Fat 4-like n=1 Tax=Ciona intestinalis TaxID=7719 RepID=UPI000EF4C553|nr:protocadherin Fat 4-like [Ciona intestinalis]|eukprot:XP_026695356.1 protocadherin Fat 4-like [Ciona intestinalis]